MVVMVVTTCYSADGETSKPGDWYLELGPLACAGEPGG